MGIDELDHNHVLTQLAEIGNPSLSGNHRGRTLESLLVHIFQSVPGVALVESRCLNDFGTEELDLIFWNDQLDTGLRFIDTPIFVECKAWSGTVSGREIDHFVSMLRRKGARTGSSWRSMAFPGRNNRDRARISMSSRHTWTASG
jgi:hypothetical protein